MRTSSTYRRALVLGVALLAATSFAATSRAVSITVLNYSFESPAISSDGNPTTFTDDSQGGAPPNWANDIGGRQTRKPNSFFNNKIAATPDPDDNPNEQMLWSNGGTYTYQVLAGANSTLAANTKYTLSVDIGDRNDTPFGGADVRLGTGSTMGSNLLTSSTSSTPTPADGNWALWTFVYITGPSPANLGEALRIELHSNGVQTAFDNVRLDAVPVPEPSTLTLFSWLCGTVLIFCRRRRF